jgi:DNA replication protein DnaC
LPPAWLSRLSSTSESAVYAAVAPVNQLVEAQWEQNLSRMLARWSRVELIVTDELGYVPFAEFAAELLFQIIAERADKAAVIVTTNLLFSEWPRSSPTPGSARLCSIGSLSIMSTEIPGVKTDRTHR